MNRLQPEPSAGRPRVGDTAVPAEPDDSARRCEPVRFSSAAEAARDTLGALVRGPDVARAYAGGLDSRLRERVMVAVSRTNQCGGCTRVHRRWALRAGVSQAELDALGAGEDERLDPRSRAAVSHAVNLAEQRFAGAPSAGTGEDAREHLSARELAQVEAIARVIALANLTVNTLNGARRRFPRAGPR
jgi:AhpD family alkylhydroperoxidase